MSEAFGFASNRRFVAFAIIVVLAWFLFAAVGSVLAAFDSGNRPPLALGLAATLPVLAFSIGYLRFSTLRRFVLGLNPRAVVLAQAWRIGGIVFVILHHRGVLPGVFALPAGWGDFVIGVTAPLVAWAMTSPSKAPASALLTWHVLGMIDLVMAVTLGVLASASSIGILAGEATTAVMGRFPLSLVPTFFVPLLLILHLVALAQLRQRRSRSGPQHSLHAA